VEDDPEVCDLLAQFLEGEGHHVAIARNGAAALEFVTRGTIRPDLVLADYNLPGDIDGLQVAARLRKGLHRRLPVIILTGDMSGGTSFSISFQGCVQLRKPVKLAELSQAIQRLLPPPQSVRRPPVRTAVAADTAAPVIYVVDDDAQLRAVLREVLEAEGWAVEDYGDCYSFLESYRPGREACLLIDAYLPGMSGIELLERLRDNGHPLPSIMITGRSDVPMAVHAMRAGARDFIEKPVGAGELIASVGRALEQSRDASKLDAWREEAANHLAGLTLRQRQVMDLVLAGHPSKNIAADLGISQRTVENHRAEVMRRTGAKSLPALARIALAAATTADPPDRPADP
jgi:two-component system CheB/CheR fusion protein